MRARLSCPIERAEREGLSPFLGKDRLLSEWKISHSLIREGGISGVRDPFPPLLAIPPGFRLFLPPVSPQSPFPAFRSSRQAMSYRLDKLCAVARTITTDEQDPGAVERSHRRQAARAVDDFLYRPVVYETLHEFDRITRIKGFYGDNDVTVMSRCATPSRLRVTLFVYKYLTFTYQDDGNGGAPALVRSPIQYPADSRKIPTRLKIASLVIDLPPSVGNEAVQLKRHVDFSYTMRSKWNALVNWNGVSKTVVRKR